MKVKGTGIFTCCAPQNSTSVEYEALLEKLVTDSKNRTPIIIVVDFNAWPIGWVSKATNRRAQVLPDALT